MLSVTIEEPRNLSSLYFSSSPPKKMNSPFVASDRFQVTLLDDKTLRGRGLIATQDIPVGTCLFVIPPTVSAPILKVLKEWKHRGGNLNNNDPSSTMVLEQAAEEVLFQEMKRYIQDENSIAIANSILALEGSDAETTTELPSINCLLGRDASNVLRRHIPSDDELKQIIRRNAFGPDFVTYQSILNNLPKRPHRIIGLYPLADMMNHSCHPNTVRVYVGDLMVVHTNTTIKQGDEITTSYVPPTFSYSQRQNSLYENHHFWCSCQRCQMEGPFLKNASGTSDQVKKIAELQQTISTQQNALEIIPQLENTILPSVQSSELQRYLRLGLTPIYTSYLNQALISQIASKEELLKTCMQLHFSFITGNPSSTEHLSILHLGYELISSIHTSSPDNNKNPEKTLAKLRFWTDQIKTACMTRYGPMGNDVDSVRKIMQHTRLVLRTKDGMQKASYSFI